MNFYDIKKTLVTAGKSITIEGRCHVEIYEPNATMIIDGHMENDQNSHLHIFVNNLVITPRGKASFNNAQIVVKNSILNLGSLSLTKSTVLTTNFTTTNRGNISQWLNFRKQIFWLREEDPNCERSCTEVVAYSNQRLNM